MTKYEKITVSETEVIKATLEDESIVFIPIAEENADYQRYLNDTAAQSKPIVTNETKTK